MRGQKTQCAVILSLLTFPPFCFAESSAEYEPQPMSSSRGAARSNNSAMLLLDSSWSAGLQLGILGVGAQLEYLLTSRSRIRLQYHYGELTWQQMLGSRQYDLDSRIRHVLLSSYWHPFYSGFYITTGLAHGEVFSKSLGDNTALQFDYGKFSIELGLGWQAIVSPRWNLDLQVGILFQQGPDITFGAGFAALGFSDPLQERQAVRQSLRPYEILPHLTLSVSHRF